jgi:large subunit ribosomal protein L24
VVVQGVNLRVKHQRRRKPARDVTLIPGRIQFEGPVSISNVMLVCPKCQKATRVGVVRDEEGAHRLCKNCQALID